MKGIIARIPLLVFSLLAFSAVASAQSHWYSLPNRTLLSFSGTEKNGKIEIKGKLSASHTYDKIIVERSSNGTYFEYMGEVPVTFSSAEYPFTFIDPNPNSGVNFYRVKLINSPQMIFEISNILMIKMNNNDNNSFRIYNTVLQQSDPAITVQTDEDNDLVVEVIDMSGRSMYKKETKINKGINVVDLSNMNAGRGYFILVARTSEKVINQKIFVQ